MAGEIHIHLTPPVFAAAATNPNQFYGKLAEGLTSRGATVRIVERSPIFLPPDPEDGNFHFVHEGLAQQGNLLNTGLAYVFPFWYADPQGVYDLSSVAAMEFDPETIDAEAARGFARRLRTRIVGGRISRYDQKPEVTEFAGGHIAVFLQGDTDIADRARFMSSAKMMRTVLAASRGREVLIKPHPRGMTRQEAQVLDQLVGKFSNVRMVDANVHDVLSGAAVTVSINATASFEGLIHGVPAILCGRSGFSHCATICETPDQLLKTIAQAKFKPGPIAKFLYWFLGQQMLNAGSEDMLDHVIDRIRLQGVTLFEFGL